MALEISFNQQHPKEADWDICGHPMAALWDVPVHSLFSNKDTLIIPQLTPIWVVVEHPTVPGNGDYFNQAILTILDWTVDANHLFWFPSSTDVCFIRLAQKVSYKRQTAVGFLCAAKHIRRYIW